MDIQSFSHHVRSLTKSDGPEASGPIGRAVSEWAHTKNAEKTHESAATTAKNRHNAAILQSAVDVNINAENDALSLVLKTALEGINEALQDSLGVDAIQTVYDSGLDVSPAATTDRIVSLSTVFFGLYLEQHPEMVEDEALAAFTAVIRDGIDTGFAEAREILNGLNVLEGSIADNIDLTYDLVQEGLKSFVESH